MMRTIECARNANETTLLVDEIYTLDKGWQTGTEPSGAPYYVCQYHAASYLLTPMPSATIVTETMTVKQDAAEDTHSG